MIHHFYHVYADGQWREAFDEHVKALNEHGLAEYLNSFNVGIVGTPVNRADVIAALDECGIQYSIVAEADEGWEQVTMNRLHEFVQGIEAGWVFYAHTKGAANYTDINIAWRKSMCYHNIVKWRDFEELFNDMNVDTIGCHWVNKSMYGGTYWWARVPYLRTLSAPLMDNRWRAEEWIGSGKPRIIDLNPGWPAFERFTTSW